MPDLTPLERELLECIRAVEEWWLREGRNLPGMTGAPSCIFRVREIIRRAESREQPAEK